MLRGKLSMALLLTLLVAALALTAIATAPPAAADVTAQASCGSWQYFGCCYGGPYVSTRFTRICCDGYGNCYHEYKCQGTNCAI